MTADKRHRSHGKAELGIKAEQGSADSANQILDQDGDDGDHQELDDARPAFFQHLKGGEKAHRAEERDHEHALQRGVHVEFQKPHAAQNGVSEGKDQSSDHGSGQTVIAQYFDVLDEILAEDEHDGGRSDRLVHVEVKSEHPWSPEAMPQAVPNRGSIAVVYPKSSGLVPGRGLTAQAAPGASPSFAAALSGVRISRPHFAAFLAAFRTSLSRVTSMSAPAQDARWRNF